MTPTIKPFRGYNSQLAYYSAHPEQIARIVDSHSTYNGNPHEAARNLHEPISMVIRFWHRHDLPINIPYFPRAVRQKKNTEGKTAIEYPLKPSMQVIQKPLHVDKRRLSQQRIDELVGAHSTYNGNPYEAAPHLKSSPYTLIKVWQQANLPIQRHGKPYVRRSRTKIETVQPPTQTFISFAQKPTTTQRFLDIEEIIAQQNPLILRQYRTIQAYLDVKTVVDYAIKHGKSAEIPESERRPNLSWDLIMEEGEQTLSERLFPQLAEMAKSNKQLVLELPNFADTPLQLRHDWLFTDSLLIEDYKINLNGGKNSRSVVIWKGDKRLLMVDIYLVRTSDYEDGRGVFASIHAYQPNTERLPILSLSDIEIQGNFNDSTTLDNILQRLTKLAAVIRRNRVPPLDKPNFIDHEFKDDLWMLTY